MTDLSQNTDAQAGRALPKLAGVCGWPVHHSLSPTLHNFWLRSAKISGAYTMFAVRPDEAVYAFQSLKQTSIAGLNVTIPLKALAYEAADEVSTAAQNLGVCNVLYKKNGKLIGHNTDTEGFAEPLLSNVGHQFILNNKIVIIGAGGAARAALGALLGMGAPEIVMINRTDERAQNIAAGVNVPSFRALPWAERHEAIRGAGLVVNASAAGMGGKNNLDIKLKSLAQDAWVYDLVYTPLKTKLLRCAQKRGYGTIGGLDMLIAQARPSFKLFYGQLPPRGLGTKEKLIAYIKAQQ